MDFVKEAIRNHEREQLEENRERMRKLEKELSEAEQVVSIDADGYRLSILEHSPTVVRDGADDVWRISVSTNTGGVMLDKFAFETEIEAKEYLCDLREWADVRKAIAESEANFEDPPLTD